MGTEAGFIGRNEVPIDSDFTGVRQFESGEEAQESRFSTTRGADEREGVLEFDFEVKGSKDALPAVGFGDPAEGDFHRLRSFSGTSSGISAKSGRGTSMISSTMAGSKGTSGASGGAGFNSK